jgi:hypothetical protein
MAPELKLAAAKKDPLSQLTEEIKVQSDPKRLHYQKMTLTDDVD